jgi:hypothetical protein
MDGPKDLRSHSRVQVPLNTIATLIGLVDALHGMRKVRVLVPSLCFFVSNFYAQGQSLDESRSTVSLYRG